MHVASRRRPINPFYILLVIVGIGFSVTACAYGVMTIKQMDPLAASHSESSRALLDFLDDHGMVLMIVELVVLGIATFAAIGTDDYWQRRSELGDSELAKPNFHSKPSGKIHDESQ